jgi:hypothetical protein
MKFRFYSKYRLALLSPERYPVHKSKKGNLIFVHINKTAGTSINNALNKRKLHLTVKEIIELIGEKEFNKATTFTICRNPYNRVYSMYRHRTRTNQCDMKTSPIPFNEWVERCFSSTPDPFYRNPQLKMFAPQVEWLQDKKGRVRVSEILRFESLSEDWQRLAIKFELPSELDTLNRSGTNIDSISTCFNTKSIALIRKAFQRDFEYFSYSLMPF